MNEISDRLLNDLVESVKEAVRKEQSERLRDIYLIGDIDKDAARTVSHLDRLKQMQSQIHRILAQ